jgi:hypothetical protein
MVNYYLGKVMIRPPGVAVPRRRVGAADGGSASLAFLGFFLDIPVSICNVSVLESDIGAEDGR